MVVNKDQIESFIPQRSPFVMIDNLLEAFPDKFRTDFLITSDNIFLEGGVLREFALIENIAQSCAVGLAIIKIATQEKIERGYLGAISKLTIYNQANVNDTVHTFITPLAQLGDMFLLKGEAYVNEVKLLECEVKLAVGKE